MGFVNKLTNATTQMVVGLLLVTLPNALASFQVGVPNWIGTTGWVVAAIGLARLSVERLQ